MRLLSLPLVALLLAGCASTPAGKTSDANSRKAAKPLAEMPVSHFLLPETDEGLAGSGPVRRYDWFRNLWVQKRAQWATQVERDQGAIVFLGDSITQGWNDNFHNLFPGLKLANRGISGDTTRGVLIRLHEDVIVLNPRAVVLLIGTNDLEEGAHPWTVASNIRLIIEELRRGNSGMPVVLCQVMPSSEQKKRPAHLIRRINQMLLELSVDQPQVTVIDTWKLFATPQNDAPADLFPDLLHPNRDGYRKWAAALLPMFATLGFTDRERDEFTIENDFVSLFTGADLTGWGYRSTSEEDIAAGIREHASNPNAPEWPVVKEPVSFDGQAASADGRFLARAGRLIVTAPPGGRRIQQLHTTREFPKDFILRLQFRAMPNADSGIYIRGPQLQVRDYLTAGPYAKLEKFRPLDWNDLEIAVKAGVAVCTCNGEVLEAALTVPATGPIGFEGDRGQVEYRRIRLMELP